MIAAPRGFPPPHAQHAGEGGGNYFAHSQPNAFRRGALL